MMKDRKRTITLWTLLLILLLVCGCTEVKEDQKEGGNNGEGVYTDLSEIEDKRIGVLTGSVQALQAEERFPDASFYYFSTTSDALNALKARKIDAFAESEILVQFMMGEDPCLTYLDEPIATGMKVSGIFAKTEKGQRLCGEYNAFLKKIRESGEYDEIQKIWTGSDESLKVVPDLDELPAINGSLTMAADLSTFPLEYIKDNAPAGIDIVTAYRFAKEQGYALKLMNMDFAAIIPAIKSEKCDFAAGMFTYTEERAESVLFSDPTFEGRSVIAVLRKETTGGAGFLSSLEESFEKTFLREDRWILFAQGIGNTMIITLLSILFGTILGFAVFLLCRRGNVIANKLTGAFVWVIHGMPAVVLLMVLYYIVFGKTSISGTVVSIIAFSLVFGASMFGMLRSGVNAVDIGQTEAAYALGYTDRDAFFQIVLPQAAHHFMPDYKGQVVSLLKATSVVGYIAVQDLTKMGDIVRSRTYEAFFPLIAVTVIYFILAGILIRAINVLTRYTDPKNRSPEKILKGVKTHD